MVGMFTSRPIVLISGQVRPKAIIFVFAAKNSAFKSKSKD
jgi:hypothetical protein